MIELSRSLAGDELPTVVLLLFHNKLWENVNKTAEKRTSKEVTEKFKKKFRN